MRARGIRLSVATARVVVPLAVPPLGLPRRERMSAQENAKQVRLGYEAFNRGDITALTDIIAEDVVWHLPGRGPLAGDYQGRDAAFGYFGRLGELSGGTIHANLQSLLADGDTVVVRQVNTATRGDRNFAEDAFLVFEMREGRVVDAREYHYDLYGMD